jgi:cell division protein FtsQ
MMWWRRKDKPPRRPLRARLARFVPRGFARRALVWLLALACVGGAAWLGVSTWRNGPPRLIADAFGDLRARILASTAQYGLSVEQIMVEGRQQTRAEQITAALGVRRGDPILGFDAAGARRALEALPWVATANVERRLPDTVQIRLTERVPLALWQHQGRLAVIDRAGRAIDGAELGRYAQLRIVVGEDAPQQAAALFDMLATEPALAPRVSHAIRVSARRWNLRIDTGAGQPPVEVQLPEINALAAWSRLAAAERTTGLIQRNVTTIDLRLPDRMIVRVGRDAQPSQPGMPATTPAPPPARPARAPVNRQT